MSDSFAKPTLKIVGVGILAGCVTYATWKASWKLSEGIFAKEPEAEISENPDDEVARILSTIPEECTLSTSESFLNSQRDAFRHFSTNSSVTDRFSQESLCSCTAAEVTKPLVLLQSRIDQVMNRVDVVISSLKLLEENMNSPGKEGKRRDGNDKNQVSKIDEMSEISTEEMTRPVQTSKCVTAEQISPPKSRQVLKKPEVNFVSIHQRIEDLEKTVNKINTSKQEKNTSPSESSCCSEKWEKSSSVSIISEQGNQGIDGTTESSPRTLPITVRNLTSPGSDRQTPPSDQKRLHAIKKRNARTRTLPFTQFPTIEEDPNSYNEDVADNGTPEEEHTQDFVSDEQFTVDKEWDNTDDVEYHTFKYAGVKRQGTWPCLHNEERTTELHFCVPKINTFSQFKQSENSCFEARTPSVKNIARNQEQDTGKADGDSSIEQKSQKPSRVADFKKDNVPLRSKDFCFGTKDTEFSASSPRKCQNSSRHGNAARKEKSHVKAGDLGSKTSSQIKNVTGSEASHQKAYALYKLDTGKMNLKQPRNTSSELIGDVNEDPSELKASKHKLVTCEVDAPPKKFYRGDLNATENSQDNAANKDEESQPVVVTDGGKSDLTTSAGSSSRFRRLSPFKRGSKKMNNTFQVKFTNKKGSEDGDNASSTGQSDKEDEWIVIVPNERV